MARTIIRDTEISDKRVIMEDASDIGLVMDIFVDTLDWRITRLDVKVENRYAERLGLEKGLLKKAICPVKIHFLKSVGDVVHLKGTVEDLAMSQKRILPAAEKKAATDRKAAPEKKAPQKEEPTKAKPAATKPKRSPAGDDEDRPRAL